MSCMYEPYDRTAFYLGSIPIYWYGILIMAGAVIGLLVAQREGKRLGFHKDFFVDLLVFAIPAAIVGARLYYVIFEFENYNSFMEIIDIRQGGLAIHGALFAAIITAYFYAKVKNVSFWQIADIAAPSLLIGQMLGRWGNFMNQEAYGGPVSEAAYNNVLQYLPDWIMNQMCVDGVYHHPTFLYESVWNALGLVLLLFLRYQINPRRGVIFLSYLIWYSFGRFFIEAMRTDSLYIVGNLRTAQFVSVVLIVISLLIMFYRYKKGYADVRYDGTSLNNKKQSQNKGKAKKKKKKKK